MCFLALASNPSVVWIVMHRSKPVFGWVGLRDLNLYTIVKKHRRFAQLYSNRFACPIEKKASHAGLVRTEIRWSILQDEACTPACLNGNPTSRDIRGSTTETDIRLVEPRCTWVSSCARERGCIRFGCPGCQVGIKGDPTKEKVDPIPMLSVGSDGEESRSGC